VTTGDCVEQPQVGFQAESLVALDAHDGSVKWFHQRRLVDTSDYDIGNSPTLIDVPGPDGCSVVVTPDKNGCIYGFDQDRDVPAVGEPGFDPLRPGQQRVRWRTCLVPGSRHVGRGHVA
jgi:glucose dehydrogenase